MSAENACSNLRILVFLFDGKLGTKLGLKMRLPVDQ